MVEAARGAKSLFLSMIPKSMPLAKAGVDIGFRKRPVPVPARFAIESMPTVASTMTLPRKVHAVIFDMDGLIFDTEQLYRDAMISAAREVGHVMKLEVYHSTIGLSVEATRGLLSEQFGKGFDFEAFWATASKQFREMVESQLCLKAGVVDLLDVLDSLYLPQAIATSSRHEDVRHHLARHGLLDRFHAIVAQGDYVHGKPNPDPFLKAAERLGVEPALCLALEDSYNGVRAASKAGMMTIMVPDLLAATAEMERLCVCIVQDLH